MKGESVNFLYLHVYSWRGNSYSSDELALNLWKFDFKKHVELSHTNLEYTKQKNSTGKWD